MPNVYFSISEYKNFGKYKCFEKREMKKSIFVFTEKADILFYLVKFAYFSVKAVAYYMCEEVKNYYSS